MSGQSPFEKNKVKEQYQKILILFRIKSILFFCIVPQGYEMLK